MSNRANVKRIRQTLLKRLASDPDASFEDTVEALADMLRFYMSMRVRELSQGLADELVRARPSCLSVPIRKAERWPAMPARSPVCDIRHAKVADTAPTRRRRKAAAIRAAIRQGRARRRSHGESRRC